MTVVTFEKAETVVPPCRPRDDGQRLLWVFLGLSILLHVALFIYLALDRGLFGDPEATAEESVTVQLAAGPGEDRFATENLSQANFSEPALADPTMTPLPMPELPAIPEPVPQIAPIERPERPVRKAEKPPEPVAAEPVNEPEQTSAQSGSSSQSEAAVEDTGAGVDGAARDQVGEGAKGNAPETTGNRKGTPVPGGQIRGMVSGRTFKLEMGRLDIQGSSRLINTTIELRPDGTTRVETTQYLYRTYHSDYSSTRHKSGRGRWWIEGNAWCHAAKIINYGAEDCYIITSEGPIVRFYYEDCDIRSSSECRTGALAAEGTVSAN